MVQDARQRTKVWLDTRLTAANLVDDNDYAVTFQVMYASPNYPLYWEFRRRNIDLIFTVGEPESEPLWTTDQDIYSYREQVPIGINCTDKTNITGTLLRWTAEAELRSVAENYELGSFRGLHRMSSDDKQLGSIKVYSRILMFMYDRDGLT